jgi:hypothetical protein
MKKLMVSVFALGMMTTGAMAGEQLTTAQMDQVTAGFVIQANVNFTDQVAVARARGGNACVVAICKQKQRDNTALASNSNVTGQANVNID